MGRFLCNKQSSKIQQAKPCGSFASNIAFLELAIFWLASSDLWGLACFEGSLCATAMGGRRGFYRIELCDPGQGRQYCKYSLQRKGKPMVQRPCMCNSCRLKAKRQLARFLVWSFQCFSSLLRGAMQDFDLH